MTLIIKKRVSLEFLGEEYKEAFIVFKSIPAKDLPDIMAESETANEDTKKLIPLFIKVLQQYFLEGRNGEEVITKEDVGELDADSVMHCFQILTGQGIDPKVERPSTNTSSTPAA